MPLALCGPGTGVSWERSVRLADGVTGLNVTAWRWGSGPPACSGLPHGIILTETQEREPVT